LRQNFPRTNDADKLQPLVLSGNYACLMGAHCKGELERFCRYPSMRSTNTRSSASFSDVSAATLILIVK
jgi:hypothetical protein